MEAVEEFVGERRIARGEIVPIARVNIVDTFEECEARGTARRSPL
jgi:hypothetical protein